MDIDDGGTDDDEYVDEDMHGYVFDIGWVLLLLPWMN